MTNVYCWATTHVGNVRERNEDALALSAPFDLTGDGKWEGQLPGPSVWAIVADGMGGHAAGEVASRLAVEILCKFLPNATAAELPAALAAADWAIREAMVQDPILKGMGTTVCGIVAVGNVLTTFNIGDSRIYVLENGELQQLSKDHAVHGYMLTQCLGGSSAEHELEPCIVTRSLPKDARLLLSSDGLTDFVSDEKIGEILRRSKRPARQLLKAALGAGGHDNVTAIVLQFEPS